MNMFRIPFAMHRLTKLPLLPADPRIATAVRQDVFIDEATVHSMAQQYPQQWQEQRYFGEDFAGRDDCLWNTDESVAMPVRQQVGPFFTPCRMTSAPQEQQHAEKVPSTEYRNEGRNLWRNSIAVAAASALLLGTLLTGLWASNAIAPNASSQPTTRQHSDSTAQQDSAKTSTALIAIDNRR